MLRADSLWLDAIHCMNHSIEIALKDAFVQSYVEEIFNISMAIHCTYEKSQK